MDNAQAPSPGAPCRPARPHAPQPQWDQFAVVRDCVYTHTQPQWLEVTSETKRGSTREGPSCSTPSELRTPSWTPTVVRPPPLEACRVCTTCLQPKQACSCSTCYVCQASFLKNRHHCRRCWHAVCASCWGHKHYVHMLGRPMVVCDRCSVPWALVNASKRDEAGLLWGLYALRIAGDMPRLCIAPLCCTFTRRLTCPACGLPTVSTQPHEARVVRPNGVSPAVMDMINVLDMQQLSLRAMVVNGMTVAGVERLFRGCFHNYEEVLAFRAVTTATAAQRILLASVAAAIAYEYVGAPNITLGLSDIPYARALQVTVSRERYTLLEVPGRVKFIAFPGTHNWRTLWVDMQFSRVSESVYTRLHEGLQAGPQPSSEPVPLCGGVRKTWTYHVHGGFAREAQEVGLPVESLLEDVRHGGYTLVLCGHSMGGAIAQYLSLQLLHKAAALLVPTDPRAEPNLMCVTFGAPLLGNYELADHVHGCGWSHLFHNFVYRSDIVPRVFCTDELAWDAQSRLTQSLTSVFAAAHNWWRGRKTADQSSRQSNSSSSSSNSRAPFDALSSSETDASVSPTSVERLVRFRSSSAQAEGPLREPPTEAHRRHFLPGLLSNVVRTTAALSVGLTGGLGEGTIISEADGGVTDATTSDDEEEARIAAYMDTAIRTSRDLLEEEKAAGGEDLVESRTLSGSAVDSGGAAVRRDADVEAALSAFTSSCNRRQASFTASHVKRARSSGVEAAEAYVGEAPPEQGAARATVPNTPQPPPAASADVTADVFIPTRRMHRRFTCFGRYHFVQFGSYGYVSTADSETAFGILKHGCDEKVVLRDHSVAAYNRGLMIHLYRNLE
ncbi:putative Class 3 lipase [Leptomonas pyrrhocoris]|uniref:Putative Class 3 lipase n=1 Tax=Leptomonas pyrrhocoris TaxID=157538 RepID=A0A0N0VDZ4_LEPPY|nr:putative Class 3 lipase [Leptomonas pyrrhocoris]KPA76551.1 putative Class 3 lipase [Leptomonas pyrrhocoris]|eukprot:XP_015654990.1 putative Class 3 lipase [Leptomonas pyrrhocoris]